MWALEYLLLLIVATFNRPTVSNGFGINLITVAEDDRAQIICTMALLRKYFRSGESLSGSVLSMSITSAQMVIQQNMLNAIHSDRSHPWSVVIKNGWRQKRGAPSTLVLHEKPQCYFLVVENLEDDDLEDVFEDWKTTINWNPLAQFVVLLASVEETEEEMTELMIEILLNFMNKKIYNVNVLGQNEESGFHYGKSVFPYHPDNNCGNRVITIETLDVCEFQDAGAADEEDSEEFDEEDDEVETEAEEEEEEGEPGDDETTDEGGATDGGEGAEEDGGDDEPGTDFATTSDAAGEETAAENDDHGNDGSADEGGGGGDIDDGNGGDEGGNDEANDGVADGADNGGENYDNGDGTAKSSAEEEGENEGDEALDIDENPDGDLGDDVGADDDIRGGGDSLRVANKREGRKRVKRNMGESFNATEFLDDGKGGSVYIEELYRALFLDKFPRDLSGCPLVAAYRPWEPYIFSEQAEEPDYGFDNASAPAAGEDEMYPDMNLDGDGDEGEGEPQVRLSGIEYKMVQTIGERLHISIDIQVENNNLFHLFQQLIDGDIEMIVGGIDEDPSISQFVSSTVPYHQDDLTWCVAKAKRTYTMFNFLAGIRMGALTLIFISIVASSLMIRLVTRALDVDLRHLRGVLAVCIHVLGVVLSQSVTLKPVPSALRLLFATAFFMGLLFSNIYQSFLVSTLTTPKSSYQIQHVQEIYRYRMTIMGSVDNVRHLNKDSEIFKYIREKFQMCYDIEECLSRAADDDHIAVAVSRQHSFYNPRIPRDRLYCFDRDENIYVYLVTMLMPKKFHLLHKINLVIQHVIESGHIQKWARDLDMKRKIHEETHRVREEPVKSLTMAQVGGSFAFAGMLLAAAALVLSLERWAHWMVTKRRTRLKLVKLLHRKFS